MKKLIDIFAAIFIIMMAVCCGNTKKISGSNDVYGAMYGYTCVYEPYQIDSVCVAEGLAPIDEWLKFSFLDYETGLQIPRYTYIKIMAENEELMYIVTPIVMEEKFKLTKRIVKSE